MASLHNLLAAAVLAVAVLGGAHACSMSGTNESLFFYDMPLTCSAPFDCWTEFCFAVNGTLTTTCTPFGNVTVATIEQAAARRVTCALSAALTAVSSTDAACKRWGQALTALYSAYYTDRTSMNVTDACTADMCALLTAGNATLAPQVNYTSVCAINVTAVGNPCTFACPDGTCAADLASCACTANAVVGSVSTTANLALTNLLPSSTLQVRASAPYGVSSGSCSNFSFGSSLKFVWSVTNSSGAVVLSVNGSTLSVSANTLKAGTYTATVTATGLLSTQVSTATVTLTFVTLNPVVQISAPATATSARAYTLMATVANPVSSSSYNWSCVSQTFNVSCPSLSAATSSNLTVAAGSAAGVFAYTYTYTTSTTTVSASAMVVVVNMDIPVVTFTGGKLSGGIGGATQYSAFLSTQKIAVSGFTVAFGGAYTRSWKVNGVAVNGTADTLLVDASTLTKTTLAAVNAGTYTYNTITFTVTSAANANISSNATVSVVVLEPFTATLAIANEADSMATSAASLTDTLVFTPALTPALTTSNAPFNGALTTSIVYYASVNGVERGLSLDTTDGGATQSGLAPIIANGTSAGTVVKFGVQVSLAGVVVARANQTFTITLANLTAAANAVLASVSSITDPNQAVAALGNIGALVGSSGSSSSATLVTAGFTVITTTIVTGTQLSSTQALSVAANVATLLSLSSSNKANASAAVVNVMFVVLTGESFNLDVASAVGSTIGQMDAASGGAVATQMALVISAQVLVGESASVDFGSAGSMTAASSTGAALAGLALVDSASGAAVTMPSTLLTDLGLSAGATYGAVTLVLLVSPFTSSTVLTGGVVRQSITSGSSTVAVTGLSNPIVIKMPSGTTGNKCIYRDEVNNVWLSDGVVARVTSSGFECVTTHLTAFAPTTGSSAAAVALSVLVVALAALLQLIAA
jgi:hypothetical protein